MNAFKSAVTTAGIGALGLGAYALASPLMIPVGAGAMFAGGLMWLYQRAHREGGNIS